MRKLLLLFLAAYCSILAFAQPNTDAQLKRRLDAYMKINRELNFKELMNYIHPSLFNLATREQLVQVFESSFDNEQMSISIDSLAVTTISPFYVHNKVQYSKVDYYMEMALKWKDAAATAEEGFVPQMSTAFEQAFAGSHVSFDKSRNSFLIKGINILIAIKDDTTTPWMFLGYDKNQPMVRSLFPALVIEHFKL